MCAYDIDIYISMMGVKPLIRPFGAPSPHLRGEKVGYLLCVPLISPSTSLVKGTNGTILPP